MAATSTVASWRTASLSYLVATARWRSRRLIPHSTAWRSLWWTGSNFDGRPSREPFFLWLAIDPTFRDGAADAASAQVGAVRAGAVRLVDADLVRPGARPTDPSRGTRMRPRTAWNCGESPRCPAVITSDIGFWACSTAGCSLVVGPPRERPSPWSPGSVKTPPADRPGDPLFAAAGRVLMGAGDGGVHRDVPGDQVLRVGSGPESFEDAVSGAIALPAAEESVHRLPRPVPFGQIPPRCAGPGAEPYPVDELPLGVHRRASGSREAGMGWSSLPCSRW